MDLIHTQMAMKIKVLCQREVGVILVAKQIESELSL